MAGMVGRLGAPPGSGIAGPVAVEGGRRWMAPEWPVGMALWPFLAYQGPVLLLWMVFTFLGMRREEPEPVAAASWVGLVGALLWWLYPGRTPDLAAWVNVALWPGVIWAGQYLRLRRDSRGDLAWLLTGFHVALWLLAFSQVALLLREMGLGGGALVLWRSALVLLALFLIGLSFMTWSTLIPPDRARDHAVAAFLAVMLLAQASGWARVLGPASQRLWHRTVTSPTRHPAGSGGDPQARPGNPERRPPPPASGAPLCRTGPLPSPGFRPS